MKIYRHKPHIKFNRRAFLNKFCTFALVIGLISSHAFSQDTDGDGVLDDSGDHPCVTGETTGLT